MLTSTWLLKAHPVFEILLGVWLVSNRCRFGSWILAVALFSLFLLIAISQVNAGASSCGCFGSAKVNPVGTLILDICVLVALLALRPRWQGLPRFGPELALLLRAGFSAAVTVAAVAAFAHFRYGSVQMGLAIASGQSISVAPETVDLGDVEVDKPATGTITFINTSESEVQIGWADAKCRCIAITDLPVHVASGSTAQLSFSFQAPSKPTPLKVPVSMQTSAGITRFTVIGQVVARK